MFGSFPVDNVAIVNFTVSNQLRVAGMNQNVIAIVNSLPGSASLYDRYFLNTTLQIATYYNGWQYSNLYPGQIINVMTGAEAGLKIINQSGVPEDIVFGITDVVTAGVVYVAKNGNDGTGQLDKLTKPFLTIDAAFNAAVLSGNKYLIYVYPGQYVVNQNIAANNISYYFMAGTTVNHIIILFDCSNITNFACYGFANFVGATSLVNAINSVGITIECNSVISTDAFVMNTSNVDINVKTSIIANRVIVGSGDCECELTVDNVVSVNGFHVNSGSGSYILNAVEMHSSGYIFYVDGTTVVANINRIDQTVAGECIYCNGSLNIVSNILNMAGDINQNSTLIVNANYYTIGQIFNHGGNCTLKLGDGSSNKITITGGKLNCIVINMQYVGADALFYITNGLLYIYGGHYVAPLAVRIISALSPHVSIGNSLLICSGSDSLASDNPIKVDCLSVIATKNTFKVTKVGSFTTDPSAV